jgi:hypothetical protein
MGYSVVETLRLSRLRISLTRLRVPTGTRVIDAIRQLRTRFPGVVIDANTTFEPSSGKLRAALQHSARRLAGWPRIPSGCGRNLRIGMIDTPVQKHHPALRSARLTYVSYHNSRRRAAVADHGTAVAAMIVGRQPEEGLDGLMPDAELFAANIFEINERGDTVGNAMALARAIDWMAGLHIHSVNLSIAGSDSEVMASIFERASASGLIMIAAAGNWGRADKPAFPAAYPDVIAVTAVAGDYSVYRYANTGDYIDFAAPGVRIWTASASGGRYQSGTSFATPYIAVISAFEAARSGRADSLMMKDLLRRHALDLGAPGRDSVFGWGYVELRPRCLS